MCALAVVVSWTLWYSCIINAQI